MYTCEHLHVHQEVLSVSTRKGIHICELFQHGFIYKRICDMTYVYLWAYACTSRGSKFEHSQGHKHMWALSTRVHIRTYLRYDLYIYINSCEHMYVYKEDSKCERSQGQRQMWVCKATVHIQSHLWYNICILVSYCMYRKSFKVWALAKVQTNGISHNMGSDTKLYIIQYVHTNTCEYMYVYRGVLSVRTRKGTNIHKFAQHPFIYKRIYDRICAHF